MFAAARHKSIPCAAYRRPMVWVYWVMEGWASQWAWVAACCGRAAYAGDAHDTRSRQWKDPFIVTFLAQAPCADTEPKHSPSSEVCFLMCLGQKMMPGSVVGCAENIANSMVFVSFHFFTYSVNWMISNRLLDVFLLAFWVPWIQFC